MQKHIRSYLIVILFVSYLSNSFTQTENLQLNLPQIIELAQSDAPDVLLAKTRFTNNYWRYQSHLANYKPQIDLNSTLPNLNRSIDEIILPNGSAAFVERALMSTSLGLSLRQDIAFTGGSVFATTSLQRIDIFKTQTHPSSKSYLTTPIQVGFVQPLFGFNQLKWARKIEPLNFTESKRAYSEDMEQVAYEASQYFFDVLISQLNVEAALKDKANADTLYAISKGRFEVGRIAETELLQIELSVMNSDADLAESELNLQSSTEQLRNFLGIREASEFSLTPPTTIPGFHVDAEKALEYAQKNRSITVNFDLRLMEAERNVAEAKGNSGLNVNVFGRIGVTQTAPALDEAYKNLLDEERITVGIEMPIADWGKERSRMEIATSNRELTMMQVEQERINFEREVLLKVQQFDLLRNQVRLALRAYEVAQKRHDMTRNRYLIGKIGILELNMAIVEQDAARRSYISSLRNFWVAYYDLRRLTLYDFENDRALIRKLDDLD